MSAIAVASAAASGNVPARKWARMPPSTYRQSPRSSIAANASAVICVYSMYRVNQIARREGIRPGGTGVAPAGGTRDAVDMATIMWEREIAEVYDATSAGMFAPSVVGPT